MSPVFAWQTKQEGNSDITAQHLFATVFSTLEVPLEKSVGL